MKAARTPKSAARPNRRPEATPNTTLDPAEQARFAGLGQEWWTEDGALAGLQAYNPVRLTYIRQAVATAMGHDASGKTPLKGLSILDIGCGGGILAEPLARMGAEVTGLDATAQAIAAAKQHAKQSGLKIDYRLSTIERFKPNRKYDVVVASEVLEHVADAESFLTHAAALVRPGGVLVITTFNRTLRSLALGIIAAEHILKLAPIGTHSWKKFIKPSEIAAILDKSRMDVQDVTGALYNPITRRMRISRSDLAVNYMLWASRA